MTAAEKPGFFVTVAPVLELGFAEEGLFILSSKRRIPSRPGQPRVPGRRIDAMAFMFEKLQVYQRAVDLAEKIAALTEAFPSKGNSHLIDQLTRASLSISLNIAEGNGRWHTKDRRNFFWIARGSVFECVPLVELCKRKCLITAENHAEMKNELDVLSKMLTALIKGTE